MTFLPVQGDFKFQMDEVRTAATYIISLASRAIGHDERDTFHRNADIFNGFVSGAANLINGLVHHSLGSEGRETVQRVITNETLELLESVNSEFID